MTFEKIHEHIERVNHFGGYLLIRKLRPIDPIPAVSDEVLLTEIISSKYHHWQGEEKPDGHEIFSESLDLNGNNKSWTELNRKFYGFFDNTKIKADHYKEITYDEFSRRLLRAIEFEIDKTFEDRAKALIGKNLKPTSTFYVLDLDEEKNQDLVSPYHVYNFFYAFIAVDRENMGVDLIEFALD